MIKFLLDANLSPETAVFSRDLGLEAKSILEKGLGQIPDEAVIRLAKKEKRIIITHDLDFGEIYHFREEGKVGVLVLRLKDQTVESTNKVLGKFLQGKAIENKKLKKSLIVLSETSYRVHKG